ncbi:hypothetical protein U9M48_019003, partial [Paspalum notatum var. saurae]
MDVTTAPTLVAVCTERPSSPRCGYSRVVEGDETCYIALLGCSVCFSSLSSHPQISMGIEDDDLLPK